MARPLVYGLLVVLAIVAYSLSSDAGSTGSKAPVSKPHAPAIARSDIEFDHADFVARFDKPSLQMRNPFVPLVEIRTAGPSTSGDLDHIPADLAHGEANWIFTGLAEVDGVRLALLENSQTRRGGFVKEGEIWKTCRVQTITSQSVVLLDLHGGRQVVMRLDPNKPAKPKAAPNAGVQPVTVPPALTGPIGPNLEIHALPPAVRDNHAG